MFYDNLKKACANSGVKMTNLLSDLGLSTGNLSRWKSGVVPKSDTLFKIASYLKVSTDSLLEDDLYNTGVPSGIAHTDDIMHTSEILYERVQYLVKTNNTSINKVLSECGLNPSLMSDVKNKGVVPSAEKIIKLADYFNVSTDYLLGRTEDPRPISMIDDFENQGLTEDERQAVEAYLDIYRKNKDK